MVRVKIKIKRVREFSENDVSKCKSGKSNKSSRNN